MSPFSVFSVPILRDFVRKIRGVGPSQLPSTETVPSSPDPTNRESMPVRAADDDNGGLPSTDASPENAVLFPEEREPTPLTTTAVESAPSSSTDLVAVSRSEPACTTDSYQTREDVALNPGIPEEIRCYAILAFGKNPGARSIQVMQKLVWDPIPAVRYACAGSLAHFPGIMALPLLRRLMKDENPFVRSAAIHSLGSWKTPQVLAGLFRALKDKSKLVRHTIRDTILLFPPALLFSTFQKVWRRMRPVALTRGLRLLWSMQRPETVPLLKLILKTATGKVRRAVLPFAMKTNHPSLMHDIKATMKAVEEDTQHEFQLYMEYCRPETMDFSTSFTYVRKLENLAPLARSAHLKKLLDHADAHVRAMSVRSLGEIGLDGLLSDLVRVLERETDTNVRVSILEALPRFKEEAEPFLIEALASNESSIVRAAARGLSEIGGNEAQKKLRQVARNRLPEADRFFIECAMERITERLNAVQQDKLEEEFEVIPSLISPLPA